MTTPSLPPMPGPTLEHPTGNLKFYGEETLQAYALAAYQAGKDAGLEEAALRIEVTHPHLSEAIRNLKSDAKESKNG